MKSGKITFNDFCSFMKFMKLWEKYKMELRRCGVTISDIKGRDNYSYISVLVNLTEVEKGFWFWDSLDDVWQAYVRFEETERR